MTTMLDFGSCSLILRRADGAVLERLGSYAPGELAISSITWSELVFAAEMSLYAVEDRAVLERFVEHLTVLAYSREAGAHYGEIRESLHWKEARIGGNDLLVAAHARSLGLRLVTDRPEEFGLVKGLVVEDWRG